jgi:hypothetical protein
LNLRITLRHFIFLLAAAFIVSCNTNAPQTPDFSLTLTSSSLTIKQGETGTLDISLSKTGGFNEAVELTLKDVPTGVTASLNPSATTSKSTLSLSVASDAALQESTLSIVGTSQTKTKSLSLKLSISAKTPNPDPDDKTGPTIIGTESTGLTKVEVRFSEAIIGGSNPANFTIFSDLTVLSASVSDDAKTVTLTTSAQTKDESYALLASTKITDLAGNPFDQAATDPLATSFIGTALPRAECSVTTPPASFGLDAFYTKFCSFKGIPIISSAEIPDAALQQAAEVMNNMLAEVSDTIVSEIVSNKTRVGIIGVNQVITDLPEYSDLDTQFPLPGGESWDTRARGLGATPFIPLSSGAEENILCYPGDRYAGEDILLHEFAHTVLIMGVEFGDTGFRGRLTTAYNAALAKGLWENTYANDTVDEYWAEGVQDYYNTNIEAIPSNGIHNEINTRAELLDYDPDLHALIEEIFGSREWTSTCP